ncbi:undecaprenyl-phosphate glucose phosphotransferase [Deltaproteobacteria bacterium TL4]
MLKHHNQIPLTLLWGTDLFLSYISWDVAYWLRFYWINTPVAFYIPSHLPYVRAGSVVVILTGLIFSMMGVYRPQRVFRMWSELFCLAKSSLGLFIILFAIAFFYRKFSYSRIHMLYFIVCFSALLIWSRLTVKWGLNLLHKRGIHIMNILVIGTSETANAFTRKLRHYQVNGVFLKGVVGLTGSPPADTVADIPYLGTIEQLHQTIEDHKIDQVFIALSFQEQSHLPYLKEVLSEQMVDIKIIPDLGIFKTLRTDVDDFEGIPIITITQSPLMGWNLVLKRAFDFLGGMLALLLFSPVMILISLLIKITAPGPILYKQERMGFDGLKFNALKFRSMQIDAENQSGAVWAQKNDSRVTPLGAFLRKSSLDELPQLFNVIKGEMSLVGPRPERPVFINDFKKNIPNYMLRHKVKAGMTGWAQVNGWRGNTSLEKRIEHDLHYIENWSVWLDIRILFLTIFKGFVNPHAY